MFPTFVGMNRAQDVLQKAHLYVPHIRGDEPLAVNDEAVRALCSPHSWG